MPGPNSGVHGLICVDKEGTACTKVVLQSRVRIWRWYVVGYAVILPGRWWCSACAFSLFSVFFSSACGWLSPLGALVFFVGLFVAGLLRRTRLVAPRESAELVLVVLLFFVLLLVLAAEERFLLPC